MRSEEDEFLKVAIEAARCGGRIVRTNLGSISEDDISIKQASDFVTRVDRESEQGIMTTLRRHFPYHSFLAEESEKDTETEGYRWIIDPLDGTTNYIHGYPAFSVSIALEYRRKIRLGVILDPLRDELFSAEKGRGAFLNGEPVTVSRVGNPGDALIATGFPFRKKEMTDRYLELFRNIFQRVSDLRRAGSAALDLAYLACGRCDGFFEIGLSPWDMAAGSILIQEAGGIVTDFGGGPEFLATGNIVAGNSTLHGVLLDEVRKVFSLSTDL
ncbi:MAG TPA: inositol monophosphatase family protein [Thermodesulfovibrionales bacterium]|nr:inositol monophosphatase family protein [Thermodesulfovibrionales bacterium]